MKRFVMETSSTVVALQLGFEMGIFNHFDPSQKLKLRIWQNPDLMHVKNKQKTSA